MPPLDPGPSGLDSSDLSPRPWPRRLGAVLLDMGALRPGDLRDALARQDGVGARLGDILRADGAVGEDALAHALGAQWALDGIATLPPLTDAARALGQRLPAPDAVRLRAVPIARDGGTLIVATAAPEHRVTLRASFPSERVRIVVAPAAAIDARLHALHGTELAGRASARPPRRLSARGWPAKRAGALIVVLVLAALFAVIAAPGRALQAATLAGLAVMAVNLSLRGAALLAVGTDRRRAPPPAEHLPTISMIVPLRDEGGMVAKLLERLARLDYPRAALDVIVAVEADDAPTLAALAVHERPAWLRVIAVPPGGPQTKPRALNYALDFAHGDIVGVWDAEDAPEPDQLRRVAAHFAAAPPEVACLQGRLDYFTANHNWLTRCFAVEYAVWFRLLLPGLARMGLVVPLGGTTAFFRRSALEAVSAWDAHNVTEDADLGVRLARAGFRTELADTTTFEEPNAALRPWIRQRSRWMKGYLMTWAVHAVRPVALMRDLGPWRFMGFHVLFLSALLGALLLPAAWSTLVLVLGWPHPVGRGMPEGFVASLRIAMPTLLLLDVALCWAALRAPHLRRLWWVPPTMQLYFPLATFATLHAVRDLARDPFHWNKTPHGKVEEKATTIDRPG